MLAGNFEIWAFDIVSKKKYKYQQTIFLKMLGVQSHNCWMEINLCQN